MTPAWAQRREEMLSDDLVSPDVFTQMVERLGECVVPDRQALETAADPHPMHLYLQGLLSHVDRKNAEAIAAFVEVERQVLQDCIGTAPWDYRPLLTVVVGEVVEQLGEPDGIIAFDPAASRSAVRTRSGASASGAGTAARSTTAHGTRHAMSCWR